MWWSVIVALVAIFVLFIVPFIMETIAENEEKDDDDE